MVHRRLCPSCRWKPAPGFHKVFWTPAPVPDLTRDPPVGGPALSLPNKIVLIGVMGFKKTFTFRSIIIVLSTALGMAFGRMVG